MDGPLEIVSQLPEQHTPVTGEEDENVVYSHRAQLLHFYESAWHRRGIGQLKILQHNDNGKYRIVMRHEDINDPVCLNHMLTNDVVYKVKDPKSWHFVANDYSDGEYEIMQLCLRFKTPEIALEFKAAVDDVLQMTAVDKSLAHIDEFGMLTEEQKQKIVTLKLPLDFFNYETAEPCSGCRGCDSEAFCFAEWDGVASASVAEDAIPLHLAAKVIVSDEVNGNVVPSGNGCHSDKIVVSSQIVIGVD